MAERQKKYQKKYDLDNPKDAEDDECFEEINKANEIQFILHPPDDGLDSDTDDAPSDDEETGTIRDIGKGVLKQTMDVVCVSSNKEKNSLKLGSRKGKSPETRSDSFSSEDEVPLAILAKRFREAETTKPRKKLWQDLEKLNERKKIKKTPEPDIIKKIRGDNLQPVDMFKMLFDDDFISFVCNETQKYAISKGNHDFRVSNEEMYKYFAILLLSGYVRVPCRRMMWETKADSFNPLVSNSMSRNKFESIHRYLHFNDNATIDNTNKVYKVQPLIDQVKNVSQKLFQPLGSSFSLDEAIEPYYGRHHMKQFIKGKSIRYGFKFWCLTTSEGYLLKFQPYCGAGDKLDGKSLGSSVVEKLCFGYLPPGSTVYIDNFFNSFPLLRSLQTQNINCIGTIRSDRIEKAPLKDLKKSTRDSSHIIHESSDKITVVRWHDNSQVIVATNICERDICLTKGSCKRWSRKEKSAITVDQPTLIDLYNQGMGGVDLFDNMRGLYRTRVRSKKWYWPMIRFSLNGGVVNLWNLYKYVYPKMGLLEFIRLIVLGILTAPQYLVGPKPKCSRNVLLEVRYDHLDHLVEKQTTQRRCAYCGKCAKFSCTKCNVGLHPDTCFREYHTAPQ